MDTEPALGISSSSVATILQITLKWRKFLSDGSLISWPKDGSALGWNGPQNCLNVPDMCVRCVSTTCFGVCQMSLQVMGSGCNGSTMKPNLNLWSGSSEIISLHPKSRDVEVLGKKWCQTSCQQVDTQVESKDNYCKEVHRSVPPTSFL